MEEREVTTKQFQERLFYMAKNITQILEKYNIPYSMAYGTLLGAVRHKGFIPWDEDFDLWLFDDSYEEAIDVLRNELPDDMFLEDSKSEPKYFHAWAHVKDLYSVVKHEQFAHDDSYSHHGISLDLYRLWKVKECDLGKFLNKENRKYIMRRKELGLITQEEFNSRMEKLEDAEKQDANSENNSQEDVYALLNFYKCKKLYAKYVFPLKKYCFEDTEFLGINNPEAFLSDLYGDWKTPVRKDEKLASVELLPHPHLIK